MSSDKNLLLMPSPSYRSGLGATKRKHPHSDTKEELPVTGGKAYVWNGESARHVCPASSVATGLPWLFPLSRKHVLLDHFSLRIMIPVQGGKGLIKFSAWIFLCY